MYGIPNMKLEKSILEFRIDLMKKEGISFFTSTDVGSNKDSSVNVEELSKNNDVILLATGATQPRDLPIPSREANGIYFAMDFLRANTKSLLDSNHEDQNYINAKNKDCLLYTSPRPRD